MPCTTILVGKNASYNGSTLIARNDDNGTGRFDIKKFTVVLPSEQPTVYHSVLSHVEIPLPANPMRYTSVPNIEPEAKQRGLWAASGINEANVAMTATETITTNPRVLAADPLVEYVPATDDQPEKAGGIGEEDIVVLVLPYMNILPLWLKSMNDTIQERFMGSFSDCLVRVNKGQAHRKYLGVSSGVSIEIFPNKLLYISMIYYRLSFHPLRQKAITHYSHKFFLIHKSP